MGAAFKKRHVHIPVRTVVGLVHKAGLRRKMHLGQKRIFRHFPQRLRRKRLQNRSGARGNGLQPVCAAAGTDADRPAADKAGPSRLTGELFSVRIQHIEVEEPSRLPFGFQPYAECLEQLRVLRLIDQQRFRPGRLKNDLPAKLRARQRLQLPQAASEGIADQRAVLDRASNVHRKGNDRASVPRKKRGLTRSPPVTGKEHLLQSDF